MGMAKCVANTLMAVDCVLSWQGAALGRVIATGGTMQQHRSSAGVFISFGSEGTFDAS